MNKELKEQIETDVFRHYNSTKKPFCYKLRNPQLYYTILFRRCNYHYLHNNKIRLFLCKLKLKALSNKTQIQIPLETTIGCGFYIGHCGRVIINEKTKIGKNFTIGTGVTIGAVPSGKYAGTPTIGDNVWVGTNAVIVGNIKIGDDVLIAPNSFVNRDVPPHSLVLGNPAVIKQKENATQDYIVRVKGCS